MVCGLWDAYGTLMGCLRALWFAYGLLIYSNEHRCVAAVTGRIRTALLALSCTYTRVTAVTADVTMGSVH